jgi:hypothetical protein
MYRNFVMDAYRPLTCHFGRRFLNALKFPHSEEARSMIGCLLRKLVLNVMGAI